MRRTKAAMCANGLGRQAERAESSDLWSIFDFAHPGLLGTEKVFASFGKRLAKAEHFGPLRALVRPYVLRRLKTDKRVITDLPDKTELKAWCHLSPAQAALYQRAVKELAGALEDAEGICRKGVVHVEKPLMR